MLDMNQGASVSEVVQARSAVYGEPIPTFTRMAQMWSAILDHEVQPWEVPLMMAAVKMIRVTAAPDYSDNSDDIEGYLQLFRTIIGEDMVHASSVTEYVDKKYPVTTVQFGTCDVCFASYDVSSRDGRCGDCGLCGNCCGHQTLEF